MKKKTNMSKDIKKLIELCNKYCIYGMSMSTVGLNLVVADFLIEKGFAINDLTRSITVEQEVDELVEFISWFEKSPERLKKIDKLVVTPTFYKEMLKRQEICGSFKYDRVTYTQSLLIGDIGVPIEVCSWGGQVSFIFTTKPEKKLKTLNGICYENINVSGNDLPKTLVDPDELKAALKKYILSYENDMKNGSSCWDLVPIIQWIKMFINLK